MFAQSASHGIGGDPLKWGYACTLTAGSVLPVSRKGSIYMVDGSGTINRLTPLPKGAVVDLHFNAAPTLVHSTLLLLPGSANVTVDAGSVARFISLGNGVWRCAALDTTYGRQLAAATSASVARAALELTSPIGGMVNRIINPLGQFAQAGLASTADGAYTGFDQWLALTQSNPVTPSQLTAVENGTPYMMRMTQANASAQRMGWLQWIESANCIDLRGQAIQLSARVRMSASTTLRFAIVEWTGTADAITKDLVNDWTSGTFTAGNFFKSTTTTIVATGSQSLTANALTNVYVSGTVSGSANNLAVFFWTDSTQAQNVTLDLARAQLEVGLFATAFAPRDVMTERLLCQRYFNQMSGTTARFFGNGFMYDANNALCIIQFPVRMRVIPTITFSAANTFQFFISSTKTPSSVSSHLSTTQDFGGVLATGTWGLTAGQAGWFLADASLTATINFDARL